MMEGTAVVYNPIIPTAYAVDNLTAYISGNYN